MLFFVRGGFDFGAVQCHAIGWANFHFFIVLLWSQMCRIVFDLEKFSFHELNYFWLVHSVLSVSLVVLSVPRCSFNVV